MPRQSFVFVNGFPASTHEKKNTRQRARTHIARINKHNRQGLLYCDAVNPVPEEAVSSLLALQERKQCSLKIKQEHESPGPETATAIGELEFGEFSFEVGFASRVSESRCIEVKRLPDDGVKDRREHPRRTISPSLGAIQTNTFDLDISQESVAKASDYCKVSSLAGG
jgi:hypothetical protein